MRALLFAVISWVEGNAARYTARRVFVCGQLNSWKTEEAFEFDLLYYLMERSCSRSYILFPFCTVTSMQAHGFAVYSQGYQTRHYNLFIYFRRSARRLFLMFRLPGKPCQPFIAT